MAMAHLALLVASLAALAGFTAAQPCTFPSGDTAGGAGFWAGATSIAFVLPGLGAVYNKSYPTAPVQGYPGGGSTLGVTDINTCVINLGFSDSPMTSTQDSVWSTGKVTIPGVLASYNFFTTGNKNRRKMFLKPASAYALYGQGTVAFGVVSTTGGKLQRAFSATQTVTRFGRSKGAGTNQLIRQFFVDSVNAPLVVDGGAFGADAGDTITADSLQPTASAICAALNTATNAIGYSVVGICKTFSKTVENFIYNRAGRAVISTTWDANAAIPRTAPAATASWASYTLLWTTGPDTPPIASFIFALARTSQNTPGSTANFPQRADSGKAANWNVQMLSRLVTILTTNKFSRQLKSYGFLPVPNNLSKQGIAALKTIGN